MSEFSRRTSSLQILGRFTQESSDELNTPRFHASLSAPLPIWRGIQSFCQACLPSVSCSCHTARLLRLCQMFRIIPLHSQIVSLWWRTREQSQTVGTAFVLVTRHFHQLALLLLEVKCFREQLALHLLPPRYPSLHIFCRSVSYLRPSYRGFPTQSAPIHPLEAAEIWSR